MIIGINGYLSSGKDLTGKCIQYLQAKNKYALLIEGYYDLQEFLTTDSKGTFYVANEGSIDSGWEIRKFAKKLKQIASIILGVPIEKFEDQEFKKTYLPKEWNVRYYREGPWEEAQVFKDLIERSDIDPDEDPEHYGVRPLQVRTFLQKLGTEAMRNSLHPEVWINALFADYKEGDNWIITDTRFPGEAQAIQDKGGIIVRVDRKEVCGNNPTLKTTSRAQSYWVQGEEAHASETGLDEWDFDWVIDNNGDLAYLENQVDLFLRTFNLLQ